MKKQHFTKFCLGIALVLGSSAVHAQATDFKLEKLEAFPIPTFSWDTPAPQRGIAKEVANTPQPGQAYGDWLVEWHKQQGLPMPFPEEKMRQFHRSTRRVEANAQGKPLEFLGFLQYNMLPNNHMGLDYGFYRVSSANNWARTLEADLDMCVNGGAVYLDHKIMGMGNLSIKDYDYSRHYFCEWDADTYQPTERHRSNSSEAVLWGRLLNQACFHDPVSDRVLTFNRFSGGTTVAEVDLETLTISELATLDKNVCAAACDKYGNAYVITSDGYLNKFDLDTYEVIPVGQLDFSWGFMLQSLAFDNNTDKLYFACSEYIEETDELLGRFCEVDPNTGSTTLIGYFPEDEEYTNMYFPYVPEDSAPGKIADLSLSFKDATGHGVLSWTMPSLSYDNKTLNGVINYEIYINNDEENPLTGSAAPGASISKDIDFDLGNAKAVVLLSNTTGNGVRNPIASYAGEDTPMATDIAFSYDEATGVATLNWACAGSNGGYVDADKAVYDILRYPGPTLVAHDIAGTSFTETFDNPDWDTYYYRINAHIDNNYGEKQYSNSLQFGQPIELPFQSAFDDESDFGLFTAIDANNDDQTWHWGTYYEDYGVYYSYNHNGTPADDWLLTPPFQVEADCTYSLTVSQSAMNEPWVEKMQVFLGYGDDPTQYSALTDVMTITNTMFEPETVTYTGAAENDGVMRFAIHCTSDSYMNTLFLDNLTIKAGVHAHAPAPVDNLVVSPAEEGELAVNLSFTAPTLDATGNPLNGLDKIEIYRGEVLAGTIAPAEPGIDYTFVDEDAVNGLSDYTVLAYNEYGKGQSNTVTIYAGYDAPLAPSAIYFCDNLDGTITISWDEPIIGQNGGFVDLDEVSYVLMVPDGNGSYKEIVSNEQREYTCANYLIDGVQSVFTVGVSAVNEFGSSDFTIDSYIQGKPYGVPFEEGYVSGKMNLWLASNDGSAVEMVLFSGESPDGDGSMTGAYSEDGAGWAALTSGKISLDGTTVPKLHFFFIGFAGVDNQLSVLVNACGKKGFDEVLTIDQKDLSQTAWYDVTIDLAPYKDYPYIIIRFKAQVNDADYYIVFDDLYVGDVVNDNLAVKVEATPHITTGGIAKINAIVHNVGENSAHAQKSVADA
ncbi:MAG: fibronectin type III domain-containing protein [Bacteroidales bacterium]|nr:fibronectin type III domain-containing protein [Bacteroidales bacterium]